ncbi:hypothetical protein [Taibaiella soli]|uniref:Ubiquinone biosynthesis protein COQ4 n=1 Tax=Taibaiella soli TaxID=1649169 RepID=A0A2W2BL53_9BACT|nr:hypothetical protein [Taibaiella soli]PZF74156.1 hypothetical protein DN068_03840 [Taibaiella soli]
MKDVIIEYKEQHSLRERMLLWLLGRVVPVHARFYEKRAPWGFTRADLQTYAPGTLGHELGNFLEAESLEPIDRIERHDAFHILLGFSTKLHDEAAMQFFLLGNKKISPFTLGTAAFCIATMPDYWKYFSKQYKRGKTANSVAHWDFKELLHEDFNDIKRYIFHEQVQDKALLTKLRNFEH